ncbi:MAG: enoyl-CoA hydratase-related protein [Candidatus Binataceae bacterium]
MSDEIVRYELRDGISTITIDRPEARNALNRAVREGLWAAFRRFVDDDEALVAILTATGDKVFCAGADLKEMSQTGLAVPPPDFVPQLGRNLITDKPVIAAVNGLAYAGGFALAQMCDLCIAAETAKFAITEAKWSRGAPWAAPLPWMIPPRVALELLLTAEPIDAHRAHEIGLVNRVVPLARLQEEARALALRIAQNAPLSVRAGKRMVYATAERRRSESFDEAERIFEPVYKSEDAQEGPRAFLEKRAPVWRKR